MSDILFDFILYFGKLLLLTLGTVIFCGLTVQLFSNLFAWLLGRSSESFFDVTAIVGTPVHELGHAAMCLLFCHRIERIKLWSPTAKSGMYGYVEHSYNRKNPWARLGNLFIGIGPIFSGLGVVMLMLWLCFPTTWNDYLTTSKTLLEATVAPDEILIGIFSLLSKLPAAFGQDWLRCLLGILVILPVSLHVTLSLQDIRGSLGALSAYCIMLAVFAILTYAIGFNTSITQGLELFNLRLLSLFSLVIFFSAVWVVFALLIRLTKMIIRWF